MPHSIIYSDKILQISFSGHVSNDELVTLEKDLMDEWQQDDCKGHLYDYRGSESISFTDSEVKRIALLDRNESFINGGLKVAVVSNNDDVTQYSQLYIDEMSGSDWDVRLFDDITSALEFLGLPSKA